MEFTAAEIDCWFLDRKPPYVAEEAWREMPRARQGELHKEWKINFPAEGDLFDQKRAAWYQLRDKRQKAEAQKASARCLAALEKQGVAPASAGSPREKEEEESKRNPKSRPRPSTKKGDASRVSLPALSSTGPRDQREADLEPGRKENARSEHAKAREQLHRA